jgi:hypothetical protein
VWQRAWSACPVPGFKSAEAFWQSQLGTGLRLRTPARLVSFETVSASLDDSEGGETASKKPIAFPTPQEIAEMVRLGVLEPYDAWLLNNLLLGKTLDQLARTRETLVRFKAPNIPDAHISGLTVRLAAYRKSSKPS